MAANSSYGPSTEFNTREATVRLWEHGHEVTDFPNNLILLSLREGRAQSR